MHSLLEASPPLRTADEWRRLLSDLVTSLSSFLGLRFQPTSWFVHDDVPGHASCCNCVDVWGALSEGLSVQVGGVICVTVNFGEAAWGTCDLLLFAGGRRLCGPEGADLIRLSYNQRGWVIHGWCADDYGEWQAHNEAARWVAAKL
jgi:hypothetical protein